MRDLIARRTQQSKADYAAYQSDVGHLRGNTYKEDEMLKGAHASDRSKDRVCGLVHVLLFPRRQARDVILEVYTDLGSHTCSVIRCTEGKGWRFFNSH